MGAEQVLLAALPPFEADRVGTHRVGPERKVAEAGKDALHRAADEVVAARMLFMQQVQKGREVTRVRMQALVVVNAAGLLRRRGAAGVVDVVHRPRPRVFEHGLRDLRLIARFGGFVSSCPRPSTCS